MLKPEAMQRTVILAPRKHQAAIIEALHDLQAAHFVEFHESAGDFAEFRMGAPLPAAGPASERLVRVRALLRHLGLEGAEPQRVVGVRDLESRLDAQLDAVERDVSAAVEAREGVRNALSEGRELEAKLEPLRALPLKLEDYRGYESLTVFVGRADEKALPEAQRVSPDALLVRGEGPLFALFVPNAKANEVSEVLFRHGYAEIEVPEGAGSPDEKVRELQAQRGQLEARLQKAESDLARLSGEHRDFLLAADEHLAIAVEKAEAPLAFASTENAFVVDAWVPVADVDRLESTMKRVTQDAVHVMRLETEAHGHGHHDHAHDGHGHHGHAPVDAQTVPKQVLPAHAAPPTKYANPPGVRRFEWFTNLFSVPRYDEVDPTPIFAVFFPLFFGFMIGDLGLGLVMVLLGWLLARKLSRVDGMKQLGTAFMVAGGVAAVIGGVVFMDAFGIPLGLNHHMVDKITAAGVAESAITCHDVYTYTHEPTWGCLVANNPGFHAEPLVYKVYDVTTMLLISVAAAFVHLLIGLVLGIRNQIGHGAKHLMAKVGYLILLVTFFPAVLALLSPETLAAFGVTTTQGYLSAAVGFVVGAAILGWAEGFGGVLEIPSMFSAIMSYLRLGAVAIAKGAMAVAFNALTLVAALEGDGLVVVLGFIGFLVAQVVLFVLGVLSSGIQALRLNFVEFFTKFYQGGGTAFKPFGRARRVTTTGPASAAAVTSVLSNP